jgi:hypothetical protein
VDSFKSSERLSTSGEPLSAPRIMLRSEQEAYIHSSEVPLRYRRPRSCYPCSCFEHQIQEMKVEWCEATLALTTSLMVMLHVRLRVRATELVISSESACLFQLPFSAVSL